MGSSSPQNCLFYYYSHTPFLFPSSFELGNLPSPSVLSLYLYLFYQSYNFLFLLHYYMNCSSSSSCLYLLFLSNFLCHLGCHCLGCLYSSYFPAGPFWHFY